MGKVVILGAGLTGLSAAYHLEKENFFDYAIFEKNNEPGGLLRTHKCNSFYFDYTGHFIHIRSSEFLDFIQQISNISDFHCITRNSAIFSKNVFSNYPFQINLHGLPEKVIYECINGFLNRKKNIKNPSNLLEWILKHFGSGIGKHFLIPYNKKILSFDITKVTPSWTGRFVPKTSLKSMIHGALSAQSQDKIGYNCQFYYPKQSGIQFLINQIIRKLNKKIKTNHTAVSIDANKKIIHFENGHKEKYEKLITTMPLDNLIDSLVSSSRDNFSSAKQNLICNSVINFNLGFNQVPFVVSDSVKPCEAESYRREKLHWLYFPEKQFPFYRMGFWHNVAPGYVKHGFGGIYGETSYIAKTKTKNQIKSSKETFNVLEKKSIEKALKFLDLKETNIVANKTLHIKHAYVIYNKWREKNLEKLLNYLRNKDIYSIGRYGAWKYSSMEEAVLDGKKTGEILVNEMRKSTRHMGARGPHGPGYSNNAPGELILKNN